MKTNKWSTIASIIALTLGMVCGVVWGGEVKTALTENIIDFTSEVSDLYVEYSYDEAGKLTTLIEFTLPHSVPFAITDSEIWTEYPVGNEYGNTGGFNNTPGPVYKIELYGNTEGFITYNSETRKFSIKQRLMYKFGSSGQIIDVSTDPKDLNHLVFQLREKDAFVDHPVYTLSADVMTTKVKFQSGKKSKKR